MNTFVRNARSCLYKEAATPSGKSSQHSMLRQFTQAVNLPQGIIATILYVKLIRQEMIGSANTKIFPRQ